MWVVPHSITLSKHKPLLPQFRMFKYVYFLYLMALQMQVNYLIGCLTQERATCPDAARKAGYVGLLERWYVGLKHVIHI